MTSETRKVFDNWFVDHYDVLVQYAKRLHWQGYDLVHHTYLKVTKQGAGVMDNPLAYFRSAMYVNATRGDFQKLYRVYDTYHQEVVDEQRSVNSFMKEEVYILANHLSWFDRTILFLYLDGQQMRKLASETGIPESHIYKSISNSKQKLRDAICQRQNKEGASSNL